MAESSEVQALEKISTEVGESQIKITLSSQCIKAQAFLVDKLKKQSERQKEICNFISSNNLKVLAEIKQAEAEIKSLIVAHETVKSGNTELRKELLLAKVKKSEIAERVFNGEKKYEALWLESKERYESIPFVQKVLQATTKIQTLKDNVASLHDKYQLLNNEFKAKKMFFAKLNRSRVIELAEYLVNDYPKKIKTIEEKSKAIDEMSKEIDGLVKEQGVLLNEDCIKIPVKENMTVREETITAKLDEGWMNISTNKERDIITMPRLQFMNSDFDALNARLDQIKIMKVEIMNTSTLKRINPIETSSDFCKKRVKDDEFSIFFKQNPTNNDSQNEKKDDTYSSRKLINILHDVKLDKNDALAMVSKVDLNNLKGVNTIGTDSKKFGDSSEVTNEKENEIIEELDLTKPSSHNNTSLLIPPTQFLDLSQEKIISNSQQQVEVIVHMSMTEPNSGNTSQPFKNSQENINKKRVSFDMPLSIQEITDKTIENDIEQTNNDVGTTANETIDSQIDISVASDESYSKIKDMILKKHNLDLSPQFTYAKKMLQPSTNDTGITSKFFMTDKCNIDNVNENKMEEVTESLKGNDNPKLSIKEISKIHENEEEMDVDQVVVSSPKASHAGKTDRSVTGLLFNHSSQGIPDSLNVSISTTGFEEGDTDFPHCIDSSLLLSPKADLPMPVSSDNIDVTSQEVPNFLSGLRKTGLSFFGQSAAAESKPDTSGQNSENNFMFNFGGKEQKSRGGLFSMFR